MKIDEFIECLRSNAEKTQDNVLAFEMHDDRIKKHKEDGLESEYNEQYVDDLLYIMLDSGMGMDEIIGAMQKRDQSEKKDQNYECLYQYGTNRQIQVIKNFIRMNRDYKSEKSPQPY